MQTLGLGFYKSCLGAYPGVGALESGNTGTVGAGFLSAHFEIGAYILPGLTTR